MQTRRITQQQKKYEDKRKKVKGVLSGESLENKVRGPRRKVRREDNIKKNEEVHLIKELKGQGKNQNNGRLAKSIHEEDSNSLMTFAEIMLLAAAKEDEINITNQPKSETTISKPKTNPIQNIINNHNVEVSDEIFPYELLDISDSLDPPTFPNLTESGTQCYNPSLLFNHKLRSYKRGSTHVATAYFIFYRQKYRLHSKVSGVKKTSANKLSLDPTFEARNLKRKDEKNNHQNTIINSTKNSNIQLPSINNLKCSLPNESLNSNEIPWKNSKNGFTPYPGYNDSFLFPTRIMNDVSLHNSYQNKNHVLMPKDFVIERSPLENLFKQENPGINVTLPQYKTEIKPKVSEQPRNGLYPKITNYAEDQRLDTIVNPNLTASYPIRNFGMPIGYSNKDYLFSGDKLKAYQNSVKIQMLLNEDENVYSKTLINGKLSSIPSFHKMNAFMGNKLTKSDSMKLSKIIS